MRRRYDRERNKILLEGENLDRILDVGFTDIRSSMLLGGKMSHVYLITNLINGKQYVGAEKNGNNPEYYGSSWKINKIRKRLGEKEFKKRFKKEILIDNIDDWYECLDIEESVISQLEQYVLAPNGYNKKIYAWPPPAEAQSMGGKIGNHSNAGKRTQELYPEEVKEWGSKGGKIGGKIGNHSNAGKRTQELYPEEMKEWSSEGGKNSAHVLFTVDGIVQMTTLGRILNWM